MWNIIIHIPGTCVLEYFVSDEEISSHISRFLVTGVIFGRYIYVFHPNQLNKYSDLEILLLEKMPSFCFFFCRCVCLLNLFSQFKQKTHCLPVEIENIPVIQLQIQNNEYLQSSDLNRHFNSAFLLEIYISANVHKHIMLQILEVA